MMNTESLKVWEAGQRAMVDQRLGTGTAKPGDIPHADGGIAAAALLDVCADCDHYQDNVNGGEPLDPPCRLAMQWNVCTWREMAQQVASGRARHPDNRCPWGRR